MSGEMMFRQCGEVVFDVSLQIGQRKMRSNVKGVHGEQSLIDFVPMEISKRQMLQPHGFRKSTLLQTVIHRKKLIIEDIGNRYKNKRRERNSTRHDPVEGSRKARNAPRAGRRERKGQGLI